MTVFCQYLDPAEPGLLDLLSAILQALRQQTASWLALDVSDERQWGMALVREGAVQGCGQMGSLQAVDAAWCRQNVAGMASDGQRRWYSEPLAYPGRVFIFGGGHVSQALVPVLVSIGFPALSSTTGLNLPTRPYSRKQKPSMRLIMRPSRQTWA